MKRLLMKCYEAYTNSDTTEGRGHDVHIGYFVDSGDAKRAAEGKGVMGTNADVRNVTVDVKVYQNWSEWEEEQQGALKRRALAKLTDEEKIALGLSLD